jgi:hypothetical protein
MYYILTFGCDHSSTLFLGVNICKKLGASEARALAATPSIPSSSPKNSMEMRWTQKPGEGGLPPGSPR